MAKKKNISTTKSGGGGTLSALALYQTVPDDPKQEMVRQIANAMSFCLFFLWPALHLRTCYPKTEKTISVGLFLNKQNRICLLENQAERQDR